MLMVEGRLQTRAWEAKDGQTRRTTEIVAERIQLGPRASGQGSQQTNASAPPKAEEKKEEMPVIDLDSDDIKPEDLPF